MPSDDPQLQRLRTGDLANLWAGSRHTASHIALLAECDAELLRAAGRLDVERVPAELARRLRRVPELERRILWTRAGVERRGRGTPGMWPARPARPGRSAPVGPPCRGGSSMAACTNRRKP